MDRSRSLRRASQRRGSCINTVDHLLWLVGWQGGLLPSRQALRIQPHASRTGCHGATLQRPGRAGWRKGIVRGVLLPKRNGHGNQRRANIGDACARCRLSVLRLRAKTSLHSPGVRIAQGSNLASVTRRPLIPHLGGRCKLPPRVVLAHAHGSKCFRVLPAGCGHLLMRAQPIGETSAIGEAPRPLADRHATPRCGPGFLDTRRRGAPLPNPMGGSTLWHGKANRRPVVARCTTPACPKHRSAMPVHACPHKKRRACECGHWHGRRARSLATKCMCVFKSV